MEIDSRREQSVGTQGDELGWDSRVEYRSRSRERLARWESPARGDGRAGEMSHRGLNAHLATGGALPCLDPERASHRWRRNLHALWSGVIPACILLPFAISLVTGTVIVAGLWVPSKAPLETAAIQVLSLTTALCVLRFTISKRPFFLWAAALSGVLLSREIHFAGTGAGVYIGLLILFLLALHHTEKLRDYLESRFVINALVVGFCLYAIACTIDARWWKPRVFSPGIPGEEIFHVPLEESMELLGHIVISLGVIGARRVGLSPRR